MVVDFPPLTKTDRCDRCPAQARAITMHQGGLLYWCAHHFKYHRKALQSAVAVSAPSV